MIEKEILIKMESRGESELQQLVSSDVDGENDDSIVQDDNTITEDKVASPIRSNKVRLIILIYFAI